MSASVYVVLLWSDWDWADSVVAVCATEAATRRYIEANPPEWAGDEYHVQHRQVID